MSGSKKDKIYKIDRKSEFISSLGYVAKQYRTQFTVFIVYFILMTLTFLLEPSSISQSDRIKNIGKVMSRQESEGINFSDTPLSATFALITPAFIAGVLLTAASRFIRDVTGSEFDAVKSWNAAKKLIDEASNHIVVVGLGRVGLNLIQMLHDAGYSVIGIDIDRKERIETPLETKTLGWVIYAKFATRNVDHLKDKVPAIWSKDGDLTALKRANINRARAVCFMTANFDANLFLLMAIRQSHPHLSIITRVRTHKEARTLFSGGIDRLVEPKNFGAEEISNLLEVAHLNLIRVYGVINENEYLHLLKKLNDQGFKFIKIWRWQAMNQNCSVKMLVQAPSSDVSLEIFPRSLQLESANVTSMIGEEIK